MGGKKNRGFRLPLVGPACRERKKPVSLSLVVQAAWLVCWADGQLVLWPVGPVARGGLHVNVKADLVIDPLFSA